MLALIAFLLSFALSYIGTVMLLRVRLRRGFIDVPNERSSHEAPKARFGGIAIMAAFAVTFSLIAIVRPEVRMYIPLTAGALVVFAVGILDDWRGMPVWLRFAAQGLAAAMLIASGHVVDHLFLPLAGTISLGWLAIPVTIAFILTSINFYNFIDGIDGLAAGSAIIVAGFMALFAHMLGHDAMSLVCLTIAGASIGFLQFNFPPSRLFMGDSGSTVLGYLFAGVAVIGNGLTPELPIFIPILILSSLYLDAGLTLFNRAVKGERIFQPHHTHYYQRLLSLGLNHKQVTVLEYAVTTMLGISALVFFWSDGLFPLVLAATWLGAFVLMILKIRSLERGDRAFWERRTLMVIAGDIALIAVAYFGAYFLRMNFQFTENEGAAVLAAFPVVLIVQSASFYYFGLYRGVWKYTSTPDIVRIIKAVTVGVVVSVVLMVLLNRFTAIPRSLFLIEYVLLILLISGARFASRLFHEFGKEALGAKARRVAIIGAGDYADRVAREIRDVDGSTVAIACYVDDDEEKIGLTVRGVPVDGPIERLEEICDQHHIDSLVLGISDLSDERAMTLVEHARQCDVPLETRDGIFVHKRVSGTLLFDRVARSMGRKLPFQCSDSSNEYFRGKKVLLTNGGLALGGGLVRELATRHCETVVQVSSAWEAERLRAVAGECSIYIGNLDRDLDAARMMATVEPDVVFHCVEMSATDAVNREDFQWRSVVRATDSLFRVMPKFSVDSLVMVEFWGGGTAVDETGAVAAIAEVRALNYEDVLPASPKSLRLPSVLTETRLRQILAGSRGAVAREGRYVLLEPEAVAICLDTAAQYKGRAVVVPDGSDSMTAFDLRRFFAERSREAFVWTGGGNDSQLQFTSEARKGGRFAGARELVSPIYPASALLLDAVSQCSDGNGAEAFTAARAAVRETLAPTAGRIRAAE